MSVTMQDALKLAREVATWGTPELAAKANQFLADAGHETRQNQATVVYVCTRMVKMATEDTYDHGLDAETAICCDIGVCLEAQTFAGLVRACAEHFALTIYEIRLPGDTDPEDVRAFDFYQTETNDGAEPTKSQRERWEKGEFSLYEAQFRFFVEKIVRVPNVPITDAEIKASGIKVD